jgi:hypothetical protein
MIVVTLGVPGSASTWIFNVCRELLSADGTVAAGFLHRDVDFAAPLAAGAAHTLFKAHVLSRPMIEKLAALDARIFVTLRDPRDCVVSLLERFRYGFDRALREVMRSAACIVMLGVRADRVYRYENRYWEQSGIIDDLCAALDLDMPREARDKVTASYHRAALEKVVAAVPSLDEGRLAVHDDIVYDKLTHWHPNHFGDGIVGKWPTRLAPTSREIVAGAFGWFDRGYDLAPTRWLPGSFHYRACLRRPDEMTLVGLCIHDRAAIFGPGLFLPPGRWRVTAHVEPRTETEIETDILIGTNRAAAARATLKPGTEPRPTLSFDHADAAVPIEWRLFMRRPGLLTRMRLQARDPTAIKWLRFGGVALECLS